MWISGLDGFNKQRYRRWETGPEWSQEDRAVHKFPRLPRAVLAITGQYLLKAKFGVETVWLRQDIIGWVQPKLIHHWLGLVYNPTTTFRSLLTHLPRVSGRPTLRPKQFRKAFTASCLLNFNIRYWTYTYVFFYLSDLDGFPDTRTVIHHQRIASLFVCSVVRDGGWKALMSLCHFKRKSRLRTWCSAGRKLKPQLSAGPRSQCLPSKTCVPSALTHCKNVELLGPSS